ncbi:MAG: aminoacyl-tRNA hydrolase [Endomicrobium sp.]|jgi:PTH1 family peptidyl-tRNA hydrolase|nr:aminoacyl-tRNA hydrolase [Endomicrobium sp.]
MNRRIKLFIGLGNPNQNYINTRHNFGFDVLDEITILKGLKFKIWKNIAHVSLYEFNNKEIWLLKPLTFMNSSGSAVVSFINCYKIRTQEIFVFYDDISILLGHYKIRISGSSGGHNGIYSLIEHLNTENFP